MANVAFGAAVKPGLESSRKLSVADTLVQATRALRTHRQWMMKRISTVTPDVCEPETEQEGSSACAILLEEENGSPHGTADLAAPPPFQARGGSAHQRRDGLAQVSSLPSLVEEGPDARLVEVSPRLTLPPAQAWGSSRDVRDGAIQVVPYNASTERKRKKRHPSKASVFPTDTTSKTEYTDQEGTVTDQEGTVTAHFISTSSTLPSVNINAWGSLTHLSSPLNLDGPDSASDTPCILSDEDAIMEGEAQNLGAESFSRPGDPECSERLNTRTTDHAQDVANIGDLQSTSNATVVTVAPAPKNQRSTFAAHTRPKVGVAEVALQDRAARRSQTADENGERHREATVDIPEAVLQPVLPSTRSRRTGTTTVTSPAHLTGGRPDNQATTEQSNLSVSPLVVAATCDGRERLTPASLDDKETSTILSHAQERTSGPQQPSTPLVLAADTTLPDGPQQPPTGLDMRAKMGGASGDEVLRQLNLPPLRKLYIDGGEIVRQLPPLRVQNILSPSLTDITLSGKRGHEAPSYSIHRPPGGLALAPACPEYGVEQPLERDVLSAISRRASVSSVTIDYAPPTKNTSTSNEPTTQKVLEPQKSVSVDRQTSPSMDQKTSSSMSFENSRQLGYVTSPQGWQQESGMLGRRDSFPISEMPPGPGALHLAAKSGNLRRVQSLIAQGHDVDMRDHEGRTPLMYCIHSHGVHLSCADALIREGANLNKLTSDGSSAVHLAASVGAVSLLELMLLNGASADQGDFEGRLPLHWATMPHSTKGIDLIMKHSSLDINSPDDAGMTPLMWAAYNNNPVVTGYLLDQGADCEEKDSDGYTAMHWAVHRDGTQSLRLLLKPDMTYFKDHRGRTVLHHAAEKGSMGACELILRMRADAVYDTDKMGRTPLHYAAACSRVDVCALLLDRCGDASQRDVQGKTPLDYAREKKLDYVVALLTCHGTAVADFARASRSTSVSSFLSQAVSFTQVPIHSEPDTVSETLGLLADHGGRSVGDGEEGAEGEVNVVKGSYLGRFINDKNDPVQHFYFSLCPETGTISWSREASCSGAKEGRILEVHEGPSPTVRHSPAYSPADLHKHVFWVMTDRGILNLFAYNEDAYVTWVREMDKLGQNCPVAVREQLRCSRPSSAYSASIEVTSDGTRPEEEPCSSSGDATRSSADAFFLSAFENTSTPAHASNGPTQSSPGVRPVTFDPPSSLPFLDDLI